MNQPSLRTTPPPPARPHRRPRRRNPAHAGPRDRSEHRLAGRAGLARDAGQGDRTGSGLDDRRGTQPRDEARIGRHGSQGLAGAQGSGGGAERGIQQAPPRAARPVEGSGSRDRDNAGAGAETAGEPAAGGG